MRKAGIVQLLAGVPKPPELPIAHISDGTPSSTTEMMADLSFFSFSSLAGRMAADTEKANVEGRCLQRPRGKDDPSRATVDGRCLQRPNGNRRITTWPHGPA
jgi:hypothetical protein